MRFLIFIIIIFVLPYGFTISQDQQYPGQDNFEDTTSGEIINSEEEGSVVDDFQSLEPDIFLRNLYQKNLKHLSNSDKIKWSFRMSDTDIFL